MSAITLWSFGPYECNNWSFGPYECNNYGVLVHLSAITMEFWPI